LTALVASVGGFFPLFQGKIRATEDLGSTATVSNLLILLLSEQEFRVGRTAEFFPLLSGISGELNRRSAEF
jgi:hypothetical protein